MVKGLKHLSYDTQVEEAWSAQLGEVSGGSHHVYKNMMGKGKKQ